MSGNNPQLDPLLNFPIIHSASNTGTNILITGTLDAAPGLLYDLEFFLSVFCDPTGHGEGQTVLGRAPVQTDLNGHATFSAAMPLADGNFVTATATTPYGNTSEFSPCILMRGGPNIWKLTIRRSVTAAVEWPTAAVGYELQYATNISSPIQWITRTNGIFDDGVIRRYNVSQDQKPSRIFFRLIRP